MKLHASGEDYLEAVLVLQKKQGMVRSVDVARRMEVSKPSVCHAVATLKDGGFLTMDDDFFLHLTVAGREVAEQNRQRDAELNRKLISELKQKVREVEESKNCFFRYEGLKLFLFWGGRVCNIATFLLFHDFALSNRFKKSSSFILITFFDR